MADPAAASGERTIAFGPFHLLPEQRLLLEGERPIRLGSRAFDLLAALVEHAGEVVGKDALIARAWPGIHVEEGNLKFQVSALRRAIGDGHAGNRYITTTPGRGYSFVAPLAVADGPSRPVAPPAEAKQAHNLPAALTRMVGRADMVAALSGRLPGQRLITIVGPGGVGKTAVALAVAERLLGAYDHGVWLIDLAPLGDSSLVPSALAAVLGLEIRSENPLPGLIASLRDKRMLLVLDNCEHVIEAAAALAERLLKGTPAVHILATSREPLRVEGEHVYRLAPLAVPPLSSRLGATEALGFPAVQLFVERAAAALNDFKLSDAEAPLVADICTRLDGMPLAIELAAARIDAFGVRGVAARLDERFRLLTGGRRTALPRHRTLRATLDWSYGLLPEPECAVLRRLAIFVGGFTLHAAGTIAADAAQSESEIIDLVAELVAKSLVVTEIGDTEPRLRLLDTTRAYALDKLAESGELGALARRHAEYYRDLFERAEAEWETCPTAEWLADYGHHIDNLRTALDWAFSDSGDKAIGVALAAASAELWFALSLWTECHSWTARALAALDARHRGTRREMVLQSAFGSSLMFTQGLNEAARAALHRAGEIAENLPDAGYRVRALAALAASCHRLEQFQQALDIGRRAEAIASESDDPVAVSTADWILGTSLMFLGEYREALGYAERTRRLTAAPAMRRAHIVRLGRDGFVAASCTMAIALWVQGLSDQSANLAREVLAETAEADHPFSLCTALTWSGCIVPLLLGDLETVGRSIARLEQHAGRHGLSAFYAYGMGFEGQLCAERDELAAAEKLLRGCLDRLRRSENDNYPAFLSALAEVLARVGRADEGLAAAEEVVQRTERTRQLWWLPEALRIKGKILLLSQQSEAAKDHFGRALHLASQQGALSWELRAATSLARLLRDRGRSAEARQLLASVYDRFTEGFGTADLQAAKRLIDELT